MTPQPPHGQHKHRRYGRVPHGSAIANNVSRETSVWRISREQLASTFAACIHEPEFGERVLGAMAALRREGPHGGRVLVGTDDLADLATAIGAVISEAWAL